jgi:serine/threonine-protein kinase
VAEGTHGARGRDLVGTRLHNHDVVALIGEGGMGAVYEARHVILNRRAALKLLHEPLARDAEQVRRFLNEARAANAIRHPNIIEVLDAGVLEGSGAPYLLLEYLEGESLAARLRREGRLPAAEAIEIAIQVASALQAAHEQGIIHRDLKPENLFLVKPASPGAGIKAKVLDFGIAKLRADVAGAAVQVNTQAGALMGTPRYMSPEQCRNVTSVDRRTDVYALGVVLYEMVCGTPPFVSDQMGELIVMQVTAPPPPPREHVPGIDPTLERVILRALAKDPDERFASMRDFSAALTAIARGADPFATGETAIAAGAPSTTLSGSAKELASNDALDAPARGGRRWVIAVAAVLAAGAGAAFLFARSPRAPAAALMPPTMPVATLPPAPDAAAAKPEPPPPEPEKIQPWRDRPAAATGVDKLQPWPAVKPARHRKQAATDKRGGSAQFERW